MSVQRKEVVWGATPDGQLTKVKNPVFPAANIQGSACLADGREVAIMTKKDWNLYCYNFNEMNNLEQTPELIQAVQDYEEQEQIKKARYVRDVAEIEYQHSFRGKTYKNLFKWYLYYLLPIFVLVNLIEDVSNQESPRLHYWKQMFQIPDLEDYMLHEIVSASDKQEVNLGSKKNKKEKTDYWGDLEPIRYNTAEEANEVTFKDFLYTHIRLYLPGHYVGLVKDWDAIQKWKDVNYLTEKIGETYIDGVHYQGFRPFRNYAGGQVFEIQRGTYQKFKDFVKEMLSKYTNKDPVDDPRDIQNIIEGQELPEELLDDLEEPGVLKLALNKKKTTFNMYSQGTMTVSKTNKDDVLHCVVSGQGEKISMLSPWQRINMEAGHSYSFFNEEKKMEDEVSIPPNYSFKDLVTAKTRPGDARFFKVLDIQLKPGDCAYIPAYWWHQIQTLTPKKPQDPEGTKIYDEQLKRLSTSVDYWYEVQSYWLDNMFNAIETDLVS